MFPTPRDEEGRLSALRDLEILDTPPEQAYDDVVRLAAAICDMPIAMINFVDADRQWGKALVGLESSESSRDASFCARTIVSEDGWLIVPDTLKDPQWSANPQVTGEPGLRFYAGTALVTDDGHAVGSLCIADHTRPRYLDESQMRALQALARQTVAHLRLRERSLQLARANAELHSMATRDSLTGLANRAFLVDALALALRKRTRSEDVLGVLFCDLDGFKEINDELGHHTGDLVLQAVARRLAAAARASDLVARFGGDEFVVVCSDLGSANELQKIAARLQETVCLPVDGLVAKVVPGMSVGCALARDADAVDDLLKRADGAMYLEKAARRTPATPGQG